MSRPAASQAGPSAGLPLPYSQVPTVPAPSKVARGPNRTSKTANKLKVLPSTTGAAGKASQQGGSPAEADAEGKRVAVTEDDDDDDDDDDDEEDEAEGGVKASRGFEFYTPLAQIPAGSARRDAMRLTKTEKAKLPRVTAYCTAAGFNLPALQSYMSSRPSSYRTNARLFDTDCLHTPYLPPPPSLSRSPPMHGGSDQSKESSLARNRDRRLSAAQGTSAGVVEGDLLGLSDTADAADSRNTATGKDHNIEDTERLLEKKRNTQLLERDALLDGEASDAAEPLQVLPPANKAKNLFTKERRDMTGFAPRPSALSAGPKRKKSRANVREGTHSGANSGEEDEDDDEEWVPDLFVFEYGTVVMWGMTEREEKRVLANLKRFEIEKLSVEDVEMEDLNFYYANYSRIYNDVITLRKGSSFMTKLSLSHALSQSVKISLFEELIAATIDQTKDLPKSLSETGTIGMPRKEIMKQIGSLFILRINWGGSILESPEFFWSYPDLEPLYQAARSYLEIGQRIDLLNARVEVLQDMLSLLKESMNSSHGERLETIVIVLIMVEIILGILTILVDVLA